MSYMTVKSVTRIFDRWKKDGETGRQCSLGLHCKLYRTCFVFAARLRILNDKISLVATLVFHTETRISKVYKGLVLKLLQMQESTL